MRYNNGEEKTIENPSDFPDSLFALDEIMEPQILATMIFPEKYLGDIIRLCEARRGHQLGVECLDRGQQMLKYRLPLAEGKTLLNDETLK